MGGVVLEMAGACWVMPQFYGKVGKVQGEIELGSNIDVFAHEGKLLRKSAGRFSINAESPSCASGPRKFNISFLRCLQIFRLDNIKKWKNLQVNHLT